MKKLGGSGLKASVAAAVVACTWIYNVAFNIPIFITADVRISSWSGEFTCHSNSDPIYVLAARIINFFVPLVITWTSYIGIIYKLKHSMNKAFFVFIIARRIAQCMPPRSV